MSAGSPAPARPPRKSGIVIAHRARLHERLLARLIWLLIRCVAATLRYREEDRSGLITPAHANEPVIFAIWHNRLALSMIVYERMVRRPLPERRLAALVSASRDGGLLARVLEVFEVEPVRGSSSRRGAQALLELTSASERGRDLAITPDGPRGPCYVVQDGVIAAAQVTGRPIVPVSCHLGWKVRLKSWDRFQVPLPFSRCEMHFGEPLIIPRDTTDGEREQLRLELERRLAALSRD
jgi:lysophospholipid acyltransferase (LPLAT)-like uncharacterized protein